MRIQWGYGQDAGGDTIKIQSGYRGEEEGAVMSTTDTKDNT